MSEMGPTVEQAAAAREVLAAQKALCEALVKAARLGLQVQIETPEVTRLDAPPYQLVEVSVLFPMPVEAKNDR